MYVRLNSEQDKVSLGLLVQFAICPIKTNKTQIFYEEDGKIVHEMWEKTPSYRIGPMLCIAKRTMIFRNEYEVVK